MLLNLSSSDLFFTRVNGVSWQSTSAVLSDVFVSAKNLPSALSESPHKLTIKHPHHAENTPLRTQAL